MTSREPSEGYSPEELDRAVRATRARMTWNGLAHQGGIDARTGAILKPLGVVRDREDPGSLPAEVLAIVEDPEHERRAQLPPGPIACRLDGDGTRGSVLYLRDLLFIDDGAARGAAIGHFERLTGLDEPVLTPRSEAAITRCGAGLRADDPNIWRPAAVEVFDALGDDFLLNLAGFRQSMSLRYQEGSDAFAATLLRPAFSSLDSIQLEVATPRAEREKILGLISQCAASPNGLEGACDAYYARLGHLPLDGSLGMGRALDRWAGSMPRDELWAAIWGWAASRRGPLPRFHACLFFVERPALVPEGERPTLWAEIRESLGVILDEHEGDRWHAAWRLRGDLARHYLQYLECQLPGVESERVANLAWWLGERVASAFGTRPDHLERIRAEVVSPELDASTHAWKLSHPELPPSSLRTATLQLPSAWAQSLLGVAGGRLEELAACGIVPRDSEELRRALTVSLLGAYPRPEHPGAEPVYGFERPLDAAGDQWLAGCRAGEEAREVFSESLSFYRSSDQPDEFRNWLEQLPPAPPQAQILVAQLVKTRAFADELPDDLAWGFVTDPEWLYPVLHALDPDVLEVLFDALIEHQVRRGGRWKAALPHLVASALLAPECEPERRRLLFAFCVVCSISSGTVSPIDRVLQSEARLGLESDILHWCRMCQELFGYGLPWVQARIRPALASLSRVANLPPRGRPGQPADTDDTTGAGESPGEDRAAEGARDE